MGAISRIDTAFQEPTLQEYWQKEVDFTSAEEIIKAEITYLFCILDFKKEPSDFQECTLEQLRDMYEMLEKEKVIYRDKIASDKFSRSYIIDRENSVMKGKKELAKANMINFIYQYDTSVTPEILSQKTIEEIKEHYQKIKEERQNQKNKEFNKSDLSRKRRRTYYD